jgi:ATP-dependent helicase/nuclease subunit B
MDFFKELTPGTIILTPNRRLSAALSKSFQQWQIQQGQTWWHTASIMPFASWIQEIWRTYAAQMITAAPLILTAQQEQLVWEEILRAAPESEYLLQLSNTAELAKAAWSILKQWQVEPDHEALNTTEDGGIFQRWAQQFLELCHEQHWLDGNSLTDQVAEHIAAEKIAIPQHIILAGFTELSPQHKHLLALCEQMGCRISYHQSTNKQAVINRISLSDEDSEIRTMARWAKAIYENDPSQTIACVIPRLETLRNRILQIFSEVFSAKNAYTLNHTMLPFNISAGVNLSRYPVIYTGLQLLNLPLKNIPLTTVSHILRSPFLGEAEREMLPRAQYDNLLKRANLRTLSLLELIDNPKKSQPSLSKHCPALAKRISQHYANQQSQKLPISQWVIIFMEQLNNLGWPGERSLNSQEYQVVQCWLDLLNQYTTFDTVLAPQTRKQALHYLIQLTTKTIFQPQSPETNIQILGMLEAAEISFDHVWVMGLDDTVWPPAPKPNPFIPQRLQKTLHMPHATAERELIYCQKLTEQLKQSGKNVIFSHSLHSDEAELRHSPIINDIPVITLEELTLSDFISPAYYIAQHSSLESLQDDVAPTILSVETIRGGADIFKLQAACPFKAFAELRLHARQFDPPSLGLRAHERGIIIHKALEMIWGELKNQQTLIEKNPAELKALIQYHTEQAITLATGEVISNIRYLTLESQRLQKLLSEWLAIEAARPPFTVISQEQTRQVTIGKIPITLRIDRIDEISHGDKIIIDYKTGKNNSITHWFGDRIEDPQLPLYCVTDPSNTQGILFGQINSEEMGLIGICETPLDISSVKTVTELNITDATNWQEQIHQWQAALEKIGNDFFHGQAQVDPKDAVETCRYCNLHALCRIYE